MNRKLIPVALLLLVAYSGGALLGQVTSVNGRSLPLDTDPQDCDRLVTWKCTPTVTRAFRLDALAEYFTPTARTITCAPPLLCDGGASMTLADNRTLAVSTATQTARGVVYSRIYDPRDYGTLGTADDTSIFQAAEDACSVAGGGAVMVPPDGTGWRMCNFRLKSKCDLVGVSDYGSNLIETSGCVGSIIKLDNVSVQLAAVRHVQINVHGADADCLHFDNVGGTFTGAAPYLRATDVRCANAGRDCFRIKDSRQGEFTRISCRGAVLNGFNIGPNVSDAHFTDIFSEAAGDDLIRLEGSVANEYTGVKAGGTAGTRYGVSVDVNSWNNTFANAIIDGLNDASWYIEGHNNVCNGCNSMDAATTTTAAVVFTSSASENYFVGDVWTRSSGSITGYAVDLQAGSTSNFVALSGQNLVAGGFTAGSDITLNRLVYESVPYVPASPRIICRASASAGPQENCTLGSGIANSGTAIITDSGEPDFFKSGALTCGAATQGEAKVHTTPLQYCDNSGTPTLRYAAYGDSSGNAASMSGGTIANSTITLKQSTTPTPTSEGAIEWDTDDNAIVVGTGSTSGRFADGTFSTACAGTANVAAIVNRTGQWSQTPKTLTISGACDVDPTTAATRTVVTIDLPVASALALNGDCGGAGGADTGTVIISDILRPDVTNDKIFLVFTSDAGAASQTHNWIYQCQIK